MSTICVISIGKIKTPHWALACEDYITRMQRVWQINSIVLRDGHSAKSAAQRVQEEGVRIMAALNLAFIPIALDERGKTFSSRAFANFITQNLENKTRQLCFIVGGAYGLSEEVKNACTALISLGPMTFPHELAQTILMEQLYRAHSIIAGLPYHHD